MKEVITMINKDQEFMVQKIRSQYTEKEFSQLETLKALDKKVKKPANTFAYTFGSVSAVVMGTGMSFVMTDLGDKLGLGDMMIPGIMVGILGLAMALLTYPIYKKILSRRKEMYSEEILRLSESLLQN